MKTFAQTLDSKNYTVKALNEIAKQMGLKGYSKLRKADLAILIANSIEMPVILDVEVEADQPTIVKVMETVAPVAFSETPVKATGSPVETTEDETQEEVTLSDLLTAYGLMKRTWNRSTGERAKRLMVKLIALRNQVKALGYNPIAVGMGRTVS